MLIRERLETATSSRSLVTSGFISLALLSDQIVLALDRSSESNPLECRSWREADRGRQLSLWPSPSPAADWIIRTRLDRNYDRLACATTHSSRIKSITHFSRIFMETGILHSTYNGSCERVGDKTVAYIMCTETSGSSV